MVEKMRSPKSESSLAGDLNFPVFTVPQKEHWPSKMTWSQAMELFAWARDEYMRKFDSPEQRLRDKNPIPFRL